MKLIEYKQRPCRIVRLVGHLILLARQACPRSDKLIIIKQRNLRPFGWTARKKARKKGRQEKGSETV